LGTNGTYVFLTDHSGIGNEHLKPSTDDYKVELLSDVLMRIMVSFSYMPDCKQEIPEIPWEIGEDSITAVQVSSDTMENGDSVKHDTIQISWKYFPNPTNGLVHVEASHHISELHLTDLNGKLLKRITDIHPEERVQIDLSEFSSGIYMLRLPVGKQWVSGKIILVH
jgi:hypothetical protein